MSGAFDANKARTELLAEIDAVLQGTAYWQGGRLDTIKHLLARVEKAEAAAAVRGGEWCASNRAKGRGPCGACAWCCQQIMASLTRAEVERDRLRVLLNRCAPQVGSTDDPQYDLACEVNEALSNNVSAHDVDVWAIRSRLARACELDARLHDAAMHLRDVEEVHGLAEAVESARYLIADAESVLIGVEDVLFKREGRVLCLCGESAKTCKCGNDLARSVLRRLAEQRARWAREDAEEDRP